MGGVLRKLGSLAINGVWRLGFITRFFWMILLYSGQSFTRLHLTLRELYFSGVMSLLIILVSGLFVGLVLGLQGYETLQRYGASESLGTLVALSLVRELGPVVAGLLFASRAGSAVTAEIGLMKVTEQLKAMDMMAVSPIARVVAPRFWGGVISMPLLAALFSAMGVFGGWLIGVVVSAALASLLFGALLHIGPALRTGALDGSATRTILHRLTLGAILGVAGQLGDFGASIFKREAEVKDYGGLFPGHGGVLDRIDALIINAPILFLYARRVL